MRSHKKYAVVVASALFWFASAFAQHADPVKKNSVAFPSDTSLSTAPPSQTGLKAPIKYDARIIDNDVSRRVTYLIRDAVVKYENMTIEAGKIMVDWNRKILVAEALPETLHVASDSLASNGSADSIRVEWIGFPVFSDGTDQMRGERMEYNFVTGKGLVIRGRTDFDGGKYFGEQIKRVAPNILNISRGTYTTCEYEKDPHFHFWARRMKIILHERVIAKPIVMFLGKVPVAALPFAMFPTQKGRRSGLIVPRYGVSAREGRYLRGLGYYWAASDYFDAKAMVDFYEKSGWLLRADVNYALRYNFTGGISGSLTRKNFASGVAERRWDLTIRHNQTLGKTASLRVNATFVSDNSFYRDFSFNQNQRLTRRLRSQATFSKRWPSLRSSLTLSFQEDKDLDDGSIIRMLPSVQFYLNERKYKNLYFRYSVNAQSRYQKQAVGTDTTQFTIDRQSFASHDISLRMNSPTSLFGWLRLNQSLRIDEDWFDREKQYADSTLEVTERKGFFARHTFNYSLAANTTIYGLFQTSIGPIKAFRHVVTPSLSFNYRPDFSDPKWGYYIQVRDQNGQLVRRDRFGGTPKGKLASLSFSVGNLFQMKTVRGKEEKKIDLFRMNFSGGYNFAANEKKLSYISTAINATPTRNLNLSLTMSHSPYVFEMVSESAGKEIDRYLFKTSGPAFWKWLRLVNLSISSRIKLQGKAGEGKEAEKSAPAEAAPELLPYDRFEGERGFSDLNIPWSMTLTFRYSLSKFNPLKPTRRAYIDISNAEFKISKNWRVRFRGQFDLIKKQLVGQYWSIYRDLHCWEASFNWTPIGAGKGFYLRINIKSPPLQDIKFEKHGGRSSIFGGSYFY